MANIPLLQIGCSGWEVIDAINALIAAHNDGESQATISYNDLTDKPTINGVVLSGANTTADLLLTLAACTDYQTIMDTLATKNYSDAGDQAIVDAAEAAAQAVLDSKLDKDLGNLSVVSSLSEEDYVLLVTGNGPRIVRIDRLSDNVAVRTVTTRVLESSINTQLKELTVTGTQDGENTDYTVREAYVPGTQMLFLNGQLLTHNTDYKVTVAGFTMLTNTPVEEDKIIFLGVPK